MRIAFALFADAANISQEGKLNILGVFDAVQVGTLPALHPRAHLVARIAGGRDDAGTHQMTLTWRNPAGETLWSTAGELHVEAPPPGVEQMDLPFIAALDLPLDRAGTFTLAMQIGEYEVASVLLQVRSAANAPGPMIRGGALVS
ncbi:MAG TPA: hypothetical protein VHM30_14045 [Gemmatimonadaceae bacterium]|nr:hypothetical protein [Gemmatimonadaceae bacterium]